MRYALALVLSLSLVTLASAQEKVPDDMAKEIAKVLIENAAKAKTPLTIEADGEKPFAMRDGDYAALVMPAKKISADTITKADKDAAPLAQFWMKSLTPQVKGQAVPNDKLNTLKVKHGDDEVTVTLYSIGVRKGEKGPEAVIYSTGKEPLLVVPIEKDDTKQDYPIAFDVKKGDQAADLTFYCGGKYKFTITVTRLE